MQWEIHKKCSNTATATAELDIADWESINIDLNTPLYPAKLIFYVPIVLIIIIIICIEGVATTQFGGNLHPFKENLDGVKLWRKEIIVRESKNHLRREDAKET